MNEWVDQKRARSARTPTPSADGFHTDLTPQPTIRRALAAPQTLAPSDVMTLQRSIGNRATTQLLGRAQPQPHPAPAPTRAPANTIQRVGALAANGGMSAYKNMKLGQLLKPTIADEGNKFAEVIKEKGSWKQAITHRVGAPDKKDETPKDRELRQRNFNDFIKHVPVVVVPKGTELIHMTKSAGWIGDSMIGGNASDGYSFFTLAASGSAGAHANSFAAMFRMRLKQDVHTFFMPSYSLTVIEKDKGRGPEQLTHHRPSLGGGVAHTILDLFPPEYAPLAMAGHSEHELFFYNSAIPKIMEPVRVAKLKSGSGGTKEENLQDLAKGEYFESDGGPEPVVPAERPKWMGTSFWNKSNKTFTDKYRKDISKSVTGKPRAYSRNKSLFSYFM